MPNSQVYGHEKMAKSRRSALMKKFQKVTCPRSEKNVKKSQLRGHGKMPKTAGPRSRKNIKMHRSAFMQRCLKLAGPQ